MKMTKCTLMLLLAGLLALAGCSKSNAPQAPAHPPGTIDVGKLSQAFPAPSPEVQGSLGRLRFCARYHAYQSALVELNKLAQAPGLTEPQKQAINDVIAQVKAATNATPPKPR